MSTSTSDSDSCDAYCISKEAATTAQNVVNYRRARLHHRELDVVPAELRRNPRRTAPGSHGSRGGCPPALVRQSDRKVNFVDSLVDSSTQIVEAIWPLSSAVCRNELGSKAVLPLRTFIQETLRRSRTSYSTLQVALYYLILIKPHVPKHNFTTEQPEDRHGDRALQCGRRMFLAALILASKYLQDRNYSARAWSKISGLNTQEVNQNEIAFLLAVNWKLHITDDVFQRWSEIVLKYTPPAPPTPGVASQNYAQQSAEWRQLILKLEPDLTNIEGLLVQSPRSATGSDLCALSPRSILNLAQERRHVSTGEVTSFMSGMKRYGAPSVLDTVPNPVGTPGRLAPALGLLPTPRLTPQTSGFCTPAVSATSQMFGKGSAMGLAMGHVGTVSATHASLDRHPCSVSSSPPGTCPARRSSLATSVSTASSPESMVSDSSRSSSISSASSLASATLYSNMSRCSVPSRFRVTKLWNDRMSLKPSVPSVPEDYDEQCISLSPESYIESETNNKLEGLTMETPLARRRYHHHHHHHPHHRGEEATRDPASDAARALQDLHKHDLSGDSTPTGVSGRKRGRTASVDHGLQENVREILAGCYDFSQESWTDDLIRSHGISSGHHAHLPTQSVSGRTAKRVCCSAEAATSYQAGSVHPAISLRGRGIWDSILN
ncbi:hypothetical protein UVI_02032820 [Ustilaginoidea virens]|nr:hypothetical protein UVI_02032820 [Ustilaginoidea virens]